ncbi:hypothetical protein [Salinibacillus xinjiangensis]|uniref:Lipoprotein n=1 Tax=Salinibacillus xinjiangensis TaxID=1229268 RepID=A0A6G1X3Y8_9BACI|nr:hypothetical protein [Salinibacillus xinjiangensis]MRG85616.1 hypothetical protein [Salinibacillus xinjiangensis]
MKRIFMLLILLILIGCSEEKATEVVDVPVIGEEEEEEQVELPQTISIPIVSTNDSLTISLSNIPLLAYYLGNADSNVEELTKNFKATHLIDLENSSLYVMGYACQNNDCSYLFIQKGEEERIIPVADIASFVSFQMSPDQEKILLHFARTKTDETKKNHISVIDLENMEILPLKNEELTVDILNYHYVIESMEWVDEDKVQVQLATNPKETEIQLEESENQSQQNTFVFEL